MDINNEIIIAILGFIGTVISPILAIQYTRYKEKRTYVPLSEDRAKD